MERSSPGLRVAVTGATGNVGTALLRRLIGDERVTSILGVARRRPELSLPGVAWATADVATDDLRHLFDGCDVVVHLAWQFQPTRRPGVTWQANVVGSQRVFEAALTGGATALVHASSVGTYSPGPGRRVGEAWPTDSFPGAAYGREKAYVERLLDIVQATHPDLRVVRMRPAFIFQHSAATEQRRIFAGPFVPGAVATPGRLPVLPFPKGLRFQALHADDAARAYHLAVCGDARGAFNLAADPPLDGPTIAGLLGTRLVEVPPRLARMGLAFAWRAHLAPADPALFDLVERLPLLDAARARDELGWVPTMTGAEALSAFLEGLREGAGGPTPPLEPDSVASRIEEVASGVGSEG